MAFRGDEAQDPRADIASGGTRQLRVTGCAASGTINKPTTSHTARAKVLSGYDMAAGLSPHCSREGHFASSQVERGDICEY